MVAKRSSPALRGYRLERSAVHHHARSSPARAVRRLAFHIADPGLVNPVSQIAACVLLDEFHNGGDCAPDVMQ